MASPGGALLLDTFVYTGGEDAIADFTINRRSTETIDVTALERPADELARMRMPTADGGTATWAAAPRSTNRSSPASSAGCRGGGLQGVGTAGCRRSAGGAGLAARGLPSTKAAQERNAPRTTPEST